MIRKADPYRDTDVIDARAPRTNQAIVGTLSLLAAITGWWPIFGVLAGSSRSVSYSDAATACRAFSISR